MKYQIVYFPLLKRYVVVNEENFNCYYIPDSVLKLIIKEQDRDFPDIDITLCHYELKHRNLLISNDYGTFRLIYKDLIDYFEVCI